MMVLLYPLNMEINIAASLHLPDILAIDRFLTLQSLDSILID